MLSKFLIDIHSEGCITQYGEKFTVDVTSETKGLFDYMEKNKDKDLYFLSGVSPAVPMKSVTTKGGYTKYHNKNRASDIDIIKRKYVYFDFDVRKERDLVGETVTNEEIKQIGLSFADILIGSKFENIGYIVFTGNGVHLYYLSDNLALDVDTYKKGYEVLRKEIQELLQMEADSSCKNLSRIARLPGSYNNKHGRHVLVEIIKHTDLKSDILKTILEEGKKVILKESKEKSAKPTFKTNSVYDKICQVPIQEIVVDHFPWKYDGHKNFTASNGNLSASFIPDNPQNVLCIDDSREFKHIKYKFLNPFMFIKMMKGYNDKETYDYFKYRYHITEDKIINKPTENIAKKVLKDDTIDFNDMFSQPDGFIPFTWFTDKCNEQFPPIESNSYIFVAGAPSVGKTTLTLDMAIKNAKLGKKILYVGLEMRKDKMIASLGRKKAGITKLQWRTRKDIPKEQKKKAVDYCDYIQSIKTLNIVGFDKDQPTIENIKEVIRNSKCDLAIIDNFDLVCDEEPNAILKANKISSEFLNFTNEENIPILFLHHLVKQSKKESITLNSMRGSGKIGDNSDTVITVTRDYAKEKAEDYDDLSEEDKCKTLLVCKKDRDFGDGGVAEVFFKKGTFVDQFYSSNEVLGIRDVEEVWYNNL